MEKGTGGGGTFPGGLISSRDDLPEALEKYTTKRVKIYSNLLIIVSLTMK